MLLFLQIPMKCRAAAGESSTNAAAKMKVCALRSLCRCCHSCCRIGACACWRLPRDRPFWSPLGTPSDVNDPLLVQSKPPVLDLVDLLGLSVMNTSVDAELAQAATEAASQWHCQPTLLNGQPVEVVTTIAITFRLDH